MGAVTIRDLRKSFGALDVLQAVDLEIAEGEFLVLVGPSGCGKSTLLRMIAGLETVSSGEIWIGGADVTEVLPRDRNIAMVFQSYALYPHMTAAENMGFSLRLRRAPKPRIAEEVDKAAGVLNLLDYLKRKPRELSGGQRQRVAMGRAIVRDPKVFLFDEPLSNLDAKLRVQMRTEIRALHRRLGATTIYVTHDQIEAMTMADRIVVMNGGRVVQVGSPLELYDRPSDIFVAGFIGSPSMNFVPARIEGDAAVVENGGPGARFPLGAMASRLPGAVKVTLGIRPEHLSLGSSSLPTLRTRVEVVEPTGAETLLSTRLGGVEVVAVVRDRVAPGIGEEIDLFIEPSKLHFFDSEGRALAPLDRATGGPR
ncbi:ABC transporter ATP-binding protein [Histidinibacterium lentulum]|uniref:sn-glycerol-3-phosphate ABC transporter ATP-binding protein UgpC n=1 Tax=Histidinibacterium lentulum TaxID=2480588 RepID=A0A3N2QY59_9RHOB|nr:sn-glycerol-3-phosphate ABC transporter ATP-binding protein UgpC [Histidinibacterium lentulum]ROU00165.1 sn-glycerol-3-phosphate ABC transporter ATP-binding protein UgpC [Histidinibacterium lentulum]